jgi:hypothetical protein
LMLISCFLSAVVHLKAQPLGREHGALQTRTTTTTKSKTRVALPARWRPSPSSLLSSGSSPRRS